MAKQLHETVGIKHGLMTTIHAYTADQRLQDMPHSDLRRARAAAVNLVPASSGAAKAVGLVLPELNGKLDRLCRACARPRRTARRPHLRGRPGDEQGGDQRQALRERADKGELAGIMAYTEDPIVSSDIVGNAFSSIVDGPLTSVIDGTLVKMVSWYDNEWGYLNRVASIWSCGSGECGRSRSSTSTGGGVLVRVDFNVLCATARSPTTPASAQPCRPSSGCKSTWREDDPRLAPQAPEGSLTSCFRSLPSRSASAKLDWTRVAFATDVVGESARAAVAALAPGDIVQHENIRFEPGETKNDDELAKQLASLCDIYVNDAFGSAHRALASTEGITQHVAVSAAGLLLEREVSALGAILTAPERPLVAVLGGSKVSDKIGVIERFLELADDVLIGGAMCFPFFKAAGHSVGASLCEEEGLEPARDALARGGEKLVLPTDLGIGERVEAGTERRDTDGIEVPEGWMGLDIGPRTAERYAELIAGAGTVFWNGPMGVFEVPPFDAGTRTLAEAVAARPRHDRGRGRRFGRGAREVRSDRSVSRTPRRAADRRSSSSRGGSCLARRRSADGARVPLVAGTWKMNKTVAEAEQLIQQPCCQGASPRSRALRLQYARRTRRWRQWPTAPSALRVAVFAQNMHVEGEHGAYTGEIAAPMLIELGVSGVILGHSERRAYYGETDERLAVKLPAALNAGLVPILCVGESEQQRVDDETEAVLRRQLEAAFASLPAQRYADVAVAYEPIWAIGTGRVATTEQAQDACAFVRSVLAESSGKAEATRILYGGSVTAENAAELLALPDVDGALVGGASLSADSFAAICAAARP